MLGFVLLLLSAGLRVGGAVVALKRLPRSRLLGYTPHHVITSTPRPREARRRQPMGVLPTMHVGTPRGHHQRRLRRCRGASSPVRPGAVPAPRHLHAQRRLQSSDERPVSQHGRTVLGRPRCTRRRAEKCCGVGVINADFPTDQHAANVYTVRYGPVADLDGGCPQRPTGDTA